MKNNFNPYFIGKDRGVRKGSETNLGGILAAFQTAREEYADNYENLEVSDVSDFNSMDLICANYVTTRSLNYDTDESIDGVLQQFAQANNIKIEWERNVN